MLNKLGIMLHTTSYIHKLSITIKLMHGYLDHVKNIDSNATWDIFVAVCKSCHAVVKYKSFIVKGIKTCLVYFDRLQDVVGGKGGSARAIFKCFKNPKVHYQHIPNLPFHQPRCADGRNKQGMP